MVGKCSELNKIIGAVAVAGVVAAGSCLLAKGLYAAGATEQTAKRGYSIAGAEPTSPAVAPSATSQTASSTSTAPAASAPSEKPAPIAPAAEEKPMDIAPLLAKADAKAGEQIAKKCAACHSFDKGGKNTVGPNQWGLVGSHFAHKDDYNYSPAVVAMKDKKWTAQNLSDFLDNPQKFLHGTKMAFAGIKNPQERANLIAYLSTLK
jgi:cytochrome c